MGTFGSDTALERLKNPFKGRRFNGRSGILNFEPHRAVLFSTFYMHRRVVPAMIECVQNQVGKNLLQSQTIPHSV